MFARIVNLVLLTALVIAIPLSHVALSKAKKKVGKRAAKVEVCRFSACDCADPETGVLTGRVLRVSRNALAAHLSKHGDCTQFTTDDTGYCTCLTCQELCLAAGRLCRANCPSGDLACLAGCTAAFNRCAAGCNGIGAP